MRRFGVVVTAMALWVGGCFTPSIPIPPPDPSLMTFTVTAGSGSGVSEATFAYPPDPTYVGGVVFVYDENFAEGIIEGANPDGSFPTSQPFPANLGDQVIVTVQLKEQTESTCVVLQNGHQNALCQ